MRTFALEKCKKTILIIYAPRKPHERSECFPVQISLNLRDLFSVEEGFGDGGTAPSPLLNPNK